MIERLKASRVAWRAASGRVDPATPLRRGVKAARAGLTAMGDAWLGRSTPGKAWWHETLTAAMARPSGAAPPPPEGIDELTVLVDDAPEVVQVLAAAKYGADGDPWRWLGRRLGFEIRSNSGWVDGGASVHGSSGAPFVVPVPSHWFRRRHRGIDHTGLLAIEVAASLRARRRHWLSRRWGPPQVGADRRARRQVADQIELSMAYRLESALRRRRRWDPGGPVLLVDDVVTTGASLAACARVLRRFGHRTVLGAVIAAHRGPSIDELSTDDPLNWMGL